MHRRDYLYHFSADMACGIADRVNTHSLAAARIKELHYWGFDSIRKSYFKMPLLPIGLYCLE